MAKMIKHLKNMGKNVIWICSTQYKIQVSSDEISDQTGAPGRGKHRSEQSGWALKTKKVMRG